MSGSLTILLVTAFLFATHLSGPGGGPGGSTEDPVYGILQNISSALSDALGQLQAGIPSTVQIETIAKSVLTALFTGPEAVEYLPFLPAVVIDLVADQLRHMSYVSEIGFNGTFDYVIIGGGSAGSVMASRLSENPLVSVLLLEAGYAENFVSDVPMADILLQMTPMDWSFRTTQQNKSCKGMDDQKLPVPRGKSMGGSSAINTMIYMRGNPRDYDNWAANGATNWSWTDVFPYFIKAEDNRDPSYVDSGYHGVGGPLTVTSAQDPRLADIAFRDAGAYLGYPSGDVNGQSQSHFTITQRTIRDGQRCSVAKAYLETLAANRLNLKVLVNSYVTKIVFNGTTATGVQFEINSIKYLAKARKEVILSAGAINSPKILMISGVGPADHLKKLGIPIIADLPVGDNFQEHIMTGMSFFCNQSIGIDIIQEASPVNIYEYEVTKNNSLSNNLAEGTAFVKTKYANASDDYPDIQLIMIPASLSTDYGLDIRKTQGMANNVWAQVFGPYVGLNSIAIYPIVLRPYSRGWIRLNSTDPYDYPTIEPNIFGDNRDLDILVEGMKIALNVSKTPPFQRYNATPFQTSFPDCEGMALYSDEYLRCQAQTYTLTTWHPSCTVKMGATSDTTAVVDPQLRVIGVNNLRVVDASVMPTIISGNLNAPVVMIAEKAADIIKGRRLKPFLPPMSKEFVSQLPSSLQYETIN